jgi:serine/threonine-protein kinase HipA
MSDSLRVKALTLHTTQGLAGRLFRESQFVVRYSEEALARPERAISLTMPPRPEGWTSNQLPPVLAMNLPEGFLLERVLTRYRKIMDVDDDMNLLAVTSTPAAGRVWTRAEDDAQASPAPSVTLKEILAYRGTEALFDELLDRYATTSISGVQPKVVVPEKKEDPDSELSKSSMKTPELIIKAAGEEFPGLTENEFVCMSIARHVGLDTPDFWLSEDKELFVIRRFDIASAGYLGFEDMACLTGRHPSRKYEGSYSEVARAVALNCAPVHRTSSLEALFRLLVLNCVVRNGDGHLKNFGILYGDPSTADHDARLAPVYDVVSSTPYIPKDVLALGMSGSKQWPGKDTLVRFGRDACLIPNSGAVIDEVIELAMEYVHEDSESGVWTTIRAEMDRAVASIRAQGRRSGAIRQAARN